MRAVARFKAGVVMRLRNQNVFGPEILMGWAIPSACALIAWRRWSTVDSSSGLFDFWLVKLFGEGLATEHSGGSLYERMSSKDLGSVP